MTTVLVQCTQSKQRREQVPAKQLYRGQLWDAQRRFAETHEQWFILSGKHRVVCPDEEISYYQKHISDVDDIDVWAQNVAQRLSGVEGEELIIVAGSEYADPIVPLLEAKGIEVLEPCCGMKIGERVAWLREQAKARANQTLC
jgi:hypothetical protein